MSAPVPVHAEAVPGDPATLRWRVPAGALPLVGPVGACPEPLEALRADGLLTAVEARTDALLLTLAPGRSWSAEGSRVRGALQEALALQAAAHADGRPDLFAPPADDTSGTTASARLRAAVETVLAGEVGAYLASHGGRARVVEVTDRDVVLDLGGACAGCPARSFTLHARIEGALRALAPDLRELRLAEDR